MVGERVLKGLSIRQPWAEAIMHHGKRVENRTFYTTYRGPILIHVSKSGTHADFAEAARWMTDRGLVSWPVWSDQGETRLPGLADLPRGGFIGRARLIAVVEPPQGPDRLIRLGVDTRWWDPKKCGFVLADVEPLPFILWSGERGLFDVDERAFKRALAVA
jgi:hypothetical protein